MLMRIVWAVIVAVVVFLVCILVAIILATTNVPVLNAIAGFLDRFATVFGVLAGVYHFLGGKFPPW